MTDNEDDEAPPWETEPKWVRSGEIYGLIRDGRHDEARLAVEAMRKEFPHMEPHEFIPFYASIEDELGNREKAIEMLRQATRQGPDHIPHHYRLGTLLRYAERWEEADLAFQEVIALSLARDDTYFLDDAHYRRAVCLKALGRREELEKVKAEIPESLYDGWIYRIEEVS
jgi:tetratricopeptide (TPR) repeat protein